MKIDREEMWIQRLRKQWSTPFFSWPQLIFSWPQLILKDLYTRSHLLPSSSTSAAPESSCDEKKRILLSLQFLSSSITIATFTKLYSLPFISNPYSNAMKHKYGEMNLAKYQTNSEGQYLENKDFVSLHELLHWKPTSNPLFNSIHIPCY